MCEGCCGDVVHALHGSASVLYGDMSEASFEERRGQLVHEVEATGHSSSQELQGRTEGALSPR